MESLIDTVIKYFSSLASPFSAHKLFSFTTFFFFNFSVDTFSRLPPFCSIHLHSLVWKYTPFYCRIESFPSQISFNVPWCGVHMRYCAQWNFLVLFHNVRYFSPFFFLSLLPYFLSFPEEKSSEWKIASENTKSSVNFHSWNTWKILPRWFFSL